MVIDKQFSGEFMPQAVSYCYHGKTHTIYFSRPKALLPVKLINGQTTLVTWGRRLSEQSDMPVGGWANLHSIYKGKWSQYSPKPVRLPIANFMLQDYENQTHWYALVKGQWIQGLLAHIEEEYRVYIVTIIPERLDICHDRWPRIIFNDPKNAMN